MNDAIASRDESPLYWSLMMVGMLGCVFGPREDADLVNEVVEQLTADPAGHRMYRALLVGLSGDAQTATEILDPLIEANPLDDVAKLARAVSKMLGRAADWQWHYENVLASCTEPAVRRAAVNILSRIYAMRS